MLPASQPLVLVQAGAHGLRLAACSTAARSLGLRPGERLADARARVPHLVSRLHEPEKDAAVLLKLVRWSERWSPFVAPDSPDGLMLDVTGVAHLFGGEAALLADMTAKFRRLGFTAKLGLAGTAPAAWALARYSSSVPSSCQRRLASNRDTPTVPTVPLDPSLRWGDGNSGEAAGFSEAPLAPPSPFPIVPPGAEASALAALPVEALGLDGETCQTLRRLGLKRIGQLHDLPRASLARRFREPLASPLTARLDQALGLAETPIAPLGPRPVFTVREALIEPLVSAQGVAGLIEHLAQAFCARLEKASRGALRLLVKLYRVDGSRAVIPLGLVQGSHDPRHLARLIAPRLESIDLGFGIEAGTMEAVEVAPVAPAQTDFIAGRAHGSPLAELADRILNRFERLTLARLEAAESHVPERAERPAPPLPPPRPSPTRGEGKGRKGIKKPPSPSWGGAGGGARPVVLFDRPEPVEAIAAVPDGPPVRFTWRRVARPVVRAEGPERIAPEWWRDGAGRDGATASTRDYYVIEDSAGRRYWLFREGLYGEEKQPAWFIHGLFA
jgi:protein ImuB